MATNANGIERARWELENLVAALGQAESEKAHSDSQWSHWREKAQENERRYMAASDSYDRCYRQREEFAEDNRRLRGVLAAVGITLPVPSAVGPIYPAGSLAGQTVAAFNEKKARGEVGGLDAGATVAGLAESGNASLWRMRQMSDANLRAANERWEREHTNPFLAPGIGGIEAPADSERAAGNPFAGLTRFNGS